MGLISASTALTNYASAVEHNLPRLGGKLSVRELCASESGIPITPYTDKVWLGLAGIWLKPACQLMESVVLPKGHQSGLSVASVTWTQAVGFLNGNVHESM